MMLKTLAVAKHVFRESLRKRVLFVLGLFLLILLVSSLFLEAVSLEDRVKLVLRVSFGSLAFFGVMVAIFLSATSLPGEVEGKLIQVVMTKPVSRFNFLLGKILGFVAVLALLLFFMGTLSWVLIQIVVGGKTLPAERFFSPQSLTFLGEDRDRVKSLEETAKVERVWLRGPKDVRAIWRWEGLRGALPRGRATFQVINLSPAGGPRRTEVELRAYSPLGLTKVQEIVVEDGEPAIFEFESGEAGGEFQVEVRRLNPDFAIGMERESLKILAPPGSFHFNFVKCLLLLFFKLILMVVITVMGSTFLSSAVTITFSLFIYLTGHMIEFLKVVLGRIVATGALVVSCPCCPAPGHGLLGHPWLMRTFEFFLRGFTELFPNLRIFGGSGFLIEGVDIPFPLLIDSLLYMSIYAALALTIAYLFFRRKEFR